MKQELIATIEWLLDKASRNDSLTEGEIESVRGTIAKAKSPKMHFDATVNTPRDLDFSPEGSYSLQFTGDDGSIWESHGAVFRRAQ